MRAAQIAKRSLVPVSALLAAVLAGCATEPASRAPEESVRAAPTRAAYRVAGPAAHSIRPGGIGPRRIAGDGGAIRYRVDDLAEAPPEPAPQVAASESTDPVPPTGEPLVLHTPAATAQAPAAPAHAPAARVAERPSAALRRGALPAVIPTPSPPAPAATPAEPPRKAQAAPPVPAASAVTAAAPTLESHVAEGRRRFETGDVAGARSALAPAVRARNAEAYVLLGRTFDPMELERLGAAGGFAFPYRAAALYANAARLGDTTAKDRLDRLMASPHAPKLPVP